MENRGFDFDFAARVFDGTYIEWEDKRRDYGEPRFIVLGSIEREVFVVVYTWRGNMRRIIPARRANGRERAKAGKVDWEKVRSTSDKDVSRQIEQDAETSSDRWNRSSSLAPNPGTSCPLPLSRRA